MTEGLEDLRTGWTAVASPDTRRIPQWRIVSRLRRAARPVSRCWLQSLILLASDFVTWMTVYVGLSDLFGKANYGPVELLAPAAILTLTLSLIGAYKPRENMASLRYTAEHLIACVSGILFAALVVYLVGSYTAEINSSRGVFFSTATAFCVLSLAYRRLLWFRVCRATARRKLLVVADGPLGALFHRALIRHHYAQKVEFVAASDSLLGSAVDGPDSPTFTNSAADLPDRLNQGRENPYDAIVVAASGDSLTRDTLDFLATVHFQELPVYSIRSFYETYWQKMPAELLSPVWPLQAGFHLVKHSAFASAKRLADLAVSAAALVLLAPLLALLSVIVRLDSPGPVIFRQTRIGQHRRPFTLFKFRTMKVGSEKEGIYTKTNDTRITRVGNFLRRTRLDELPQLFNVLRGDMSLIGPRAEWIKCVATYEKVIPHYHFRHLVRPGITGWAQVNYPYGANINDAVEKLMFDLYYIRNFSLVLDAAVVLKTIHIMLFGKGR